MAGNDKLFRSLLRVSLLIGGLLLVTLIACRTEEDRTPVPTIESPSLVPPEVPITTLLRNPNSFEGQTIWVTGQYRALPLRVCSDTTHRSPATWTLVFGDVELYASGFDEALRPIAASGLSLTVEGRWQKWEGPVGCGRRAPTEEIWYLAASRIVSPNPLVKSDEDGEVVVVLPSPTTEVVTPEGLPIVTLTSEGSPQEPEGESPATATPSPTFQTIPSPASGPSATPRPTFTPGNGEGGETTTNTPTPTVSATATITGGTPVSETGTPTTTATATTTGNTPSATAEPADQGTLSFDRAEKQTMAANSPHSWRFTPPAEEPIIITAGSVLDLNLNLELVAPDGTVVVKANQAGAGLPETINYTAPNPTGEYELIISGEDGSNGDYVLLLFDGQSEFVVEIKETLVYGSGGNGSTETRIDHFWNFEGQAGDVISIEVSPTGNSGNLILYLIGPEGADLEAVELIDETGAVGSESLTDYTLPETGFYSIGIGELFFNPVSYSMTLTQ